MRWHGSLDRGWRVWERAFACGPIRSGGSTSRPRPPSTLDRPNGLTLDIAAERDAKLRALRCYASQMTDLIDDDPDAFRFTPAQLLPFLGDREIYIEVD